MKNRLNAVCTLVVFLLSFSLVESVADETTYQTFDAQLMTEMLTGIDKGSYVILGQRPIGGDLLPRRMKKEESDPRFLMAYLFPRNEAMPSSQYNAEIDKALKQLQSKVSEYNRTNSPETPGSLNLNPQRIPTHINGLRVLQLHYDAKKKVNEERIAALTARAKVLWAPIDSKKTISNSAVATLLNSAGHNPSEKLFKDIELLFGEVDKARACNCGTANDQHN